MQTSEIIVNFQGNLYIRPVNIFLIFATATIHDNVCGLCVHINVRKWVNVNQMIFFKIYLNNILVLTWPD